MSIALDLSLYLRDNKVDLSIAARGVLFTLAFRIGSNAHTWISQEELAQELNIDERNLRNHLNNIKKTGILIIKTSEHDKRKNTYSLAKFLVNYHQTRRVDKSIADEKCRMKTSGKKSEYRMKTSATTGRNHPVLFNEDSPQTHATQGLQENEKTPKGKRKVNKKQRDRGKPTNQPLSFSSKSEEQKTHTKSSYGFRDQDRTLAVERGIDIQLCFNKFITHITKKQGNDQFKESDWVNWLERENSKQLKAAIMPKLVERVPLPIAPRGYYYDEMQRLQKCSPPPVKLGDLIRGKLRRNLVGNDSMN